MKLTNKFHLPEQIIYWLENFNERNETMRRTSIAELESIHGHHDLHLSATSMLKSPKEIILTDRHYNEIERDATEIIDAIEGTAVHESFLTMPMREGEIREIRVGGLFKDVLVSAQFDYILNDKLGDYKNIKIGGYLFGDKEFEYVAQLSVNRFLFAMDPRFGYKLQDFGEIIMIFKDWRDAEFAKKKYGFSDSPNYPNRALKLDFNLWDFPTTEKFILRKATDYRIASMSPDDELPDCTDKERWARVGKKKTTYAKCDKYCSVKPWCKQWDAEAESEIL